jgi:hypothetical protein
MDENTQVDMTQQVRPVDNNSERISWDQKETMRRERVHVNK